MAPEDVSDDWKEIASIRHSVQNTRKQDVLGAFPTDERSTISPSEIADRTGIRLSNVSRELRKLAELNLVEDLTHNKPNYKPFAITEKGIRVREIVEEDRRSEGNDNHE